MLISDWCADVCSSDLLFDRFHGAGQSRFQPEAFKADTVTELERDVGIDQQIAFRLCARIIANHHLLAAGRDTAIAERLRRDVRLRYRARAVDDRRSVVEGKRVSVRLDLGGRRLSKK